MFGVELLDSGIEMIKPDLYHKSHKESKRNAGQLLKEYSTKMKWGLGGDDTLIDVGTGPGDVSIDYVYPVVQESCSKIVFSDISADMIEFFKANYQIPDKCELKVLDITTESALPCELEGQFDHVTSLLVLHRIPNNRFVEKQPL